jgi:hypothetical protein
MQTRSEWFLGARGGSLELNSDHLRPPSSTPLPELIGALGHGTMGTYNLLYDDDNLSEIVNDIHNSNSNLVNLFDNNNHHINNHINVNVNVNSPSSNAYLSSIENIHLNHTNSMLSLNANSFHHTRNRNNNPRYSRNVNINNNRNHSNINNNNHNSRSNRGEVRSRSHSSRPARQSNLSIVVFTVLDFLF